MQQILAQPNQSTETPPAPPLATGSLASFALSFLVVTALGLTCACETERKPPHKKAIVPPPVASMDAPTRAKLSALLKRDETRERDEPPEAAPPKAQHTKLPFILDDLVDVAPAGPAAAASEGVVLVTKDDKILLAPISGSSSSPHAVPTPVAAIDIDPKDLVARARGPAVVRHFAYWVSGSRLVREAISGGSVEVLATDARAYTQVAGPGDSDGTQPAAVAYIGTRPNDPSALLARLWVEGAGTQNLSPDGTAANTVTLVKRRNDWLALFLEARTGMSPLHARPIMFDSTGVKLGNDFIAWVAGSAQPMTLVRAVNDEKHTWALLPIERDISRFGLARITVTDGSNTEPEVTWRDYPNGVDPAPVATAEVCGRPAVLYARPGSAAPHAPQELHLAAVGPAGLSSSTLVGSSRRYSDVSIAALSGGALVVFVADHRTWARRLRCAH